MIIFETERLIVRELILHDLDSFHEMQSNPKVMQYAEGEVKSYEEHKVELKQLIGKYKEKGNDFWIYGIERKEDSAFVGTFALVKDGVDDEIGYRFLEKYWRNGYASEICEGLITYCRLKGIKKLVGYVVDKNIASAIILKKYHFKIVKQFINDDIGLAETKYELIL
ncbi:Acetyltransferase (GNAT) domain-containing protein [Tenacibaculum sp. MAR_2009_124]|uniref:GNAT family N-acetyltransferase n=1 Tax=Tenacibaculum sp. MAR_2009_124 TaxID=1250059 RepID=UPI00089C677F|nr:GNAT family N-acetyltransferase [Tenacibaculum sp. MAR_2009_124]SEB35093.1 Acetyltransferase (GNAT) domain-containing protein [Tenacibaculum sp. MAR_2009_124]